MPERPSLAEHYHEETKYSQERFRGAAPRDLDFSQQPHPYKEYHSERRLSLVPYLPFQSFPLTGESIDPLRPDEVPDPLLPALSRLLYFTNGVTAIVRTGESILLFRAAPSAGALYPTELYVVTEDIAGVPNGLHNYLVRQHQLVPVFDGDLKDELAVCCFGHPAIRHARAVVILSGVFERSAWRYHDRAYRRILLDSGHVAGNLLLTAQAEGLRAIPVGSFADDSINQLFFLESSQEGALLVIPLVEEDRIQSEGLDEKLTVPGRRSAGAEDCLLPGEDLIRALHEGSALDVEGLDTVHIPPLPPEPEPERTVPLEGRLPDIDADLHETILRRRSTRLFTGDSVSLDSLGSILDFAYVPARSQQQPGHETLQAPEQLDTSIIAIGIEGLAPGIYRYRADQHDLLPVRGGNFAPVAHRFCLEQQVSQGAAAFVVHTADLPRAVQIYGDRAYRHLHLDAGIVGQRLNIAALHRQLGVSGIGGFLDDEVNQLLQVPDEHAIVYLTALGVPAEIV